MKIKCKATVAIAREDDRSKPHIQLYRDKVIEVTDMIALTAIDLGFAVKYDESEIDMSKEKYENKMIDTSAESNKKRGRPPKNSK